MIMVIRIGFSSFPAKMPAKFLHAAYVRTDRHWLRMPDIRHRIDSARTNTQHKPVAREVVWPFKRASGVDGDVGRPALAIVAVLHLGFSRSVGCTCIFWEITGSH